MPNVEQALKDISKWKPEHNIFFEMSACARIVHQRALKPRAPSVARRRYDVIQYAKPATEFPRRPSLISLRSYGFARRPQRVQRAATAGSLAHRGKIFGRRRT
jgi:hypothetical protein